MIIAVNAFETHGIQHNNNKRKLTHDYRHEIKKQLRVQTVSSVKEDFQSKKSYNEDLPPDAIRWEGPNELHDSIIYQKLRGESIDQDLQYSSFKGKSIDCKEFITFCGVRRLCLSPFYCFYWTNNQLKIWNLLCANEPIVCFDATGSVAQRYSFYPEENCKTLFYYVLTIGFQEKFCLFFKRFYLFTMLIL